jgi:CheY-like chemotaxis protein
MIELDPDVSLLSADKSQIEQILLNLAVNAGDAMPQGGSMTIQTSMLDADGDSSVGDSIFRERCIVLSVRDTGVGIEPEILPRIFDPFFTTKIGEGTGLGLATVYGIVRQTSGHIEVASRPNQGAEFRIAWPPAKGPVEAAENVACAAVSLAGREVVLLAEDDDDVRMTACRALERCGYVVLTASCGEDAVGICRDYPGAVHVLVADVVMPGVCGRRLIDAARKLRPDLRVIVMSGYSSDAVLNEGVEDPNVEFLSKPLTGAKLASTVRRVLDKAHAAS